MSVAWVVSRRGSRASGSTTSCVIRGCIFQLNQAPTRRLVEWLRHAHPEPMQCAMGRCVKCRQVAGCDREWPDYPNRR